MLKSEPGGEVNKPLLIAKTLLFTVLMFAAFFGFFLFIWKQNPSAASACLMLEILSVLYNHFNTHVLRGTLREKYTPTRLKVVFILAVVLGVIQGLGVLTYGVAGYLLKQEFQAEGKSYYIAIIPSAAGALIAPFLAYESRAAMGQFPTGPTGMVHFPPAAPYPHA